MNYSKAVLFILMLLSCVFLSAKEKNALIIANGDYKYCDKLANPVHEANELKITLEKLGFNVYIVKNADQKTMLKEIRAFGKQLKNDGGIAFFIIVVMQCKLMIKIF